MAKYEGLGNDFLLLDGDGPHPPVSAELVRAVCHRRLGVGADGLIVVGRIDRRARGVGGDGELSMVLYNADGGRAEMSGNGIRCLALFACHAGMVGGPAFVVATDAGPRAVRVGPEGAGSPAAPGAGVSATVTVGMGRARVDPVDEEVAVDGAGAEGAGIDGAGWGYASGRWRGRSVDMGNPHLVLVEERDLEDLDLDLLGPPLESSRPGGLNVEWVKPGPGPDEMTLRVWERGVGVTLACGTGSVAAAAAALAMGLVAGPKVAVANPGGTLHVDLSGPDIALSGPARRVATVEVDLPCR
ncbi:MAG: diaminopimelate epimerase [Acidimicrobiales bacterium]